jgi:ADP-ribose pyrophosphatase
MTFKPESIEKVLETEWFTLDALQYPALDDKPYYRLTHNDSVVILAMTVDKKLIFIRQFRPAIEDITYEIPAGDIRDGEAYEEAAVRELTEETGYVCDEIAHVGSYVVAPDRIKSTAHLFFGRNARLSNKQSRDKHIEVLLVSEEDFKAQVLSGKINTIAGMGVYLLFKLKGLF